MLLSLLLAWSFRLRVNYIGQRIWILFFDCWLRLFHIFNRFIAKRSVLPIFERTALCISLLLNSNFNILISNFCITIFPFFSILFWINSLLFKGKWRNASKQTTIQYSISSHSYDNRTDDSCIVDTFTFWCHFVYNTIDTFIIFDHFPVIYSK